MHKQLCVPFDLPSMFDLRLTGMFSKPEFQQHSTVDKRGRKVANRKNQENMRKYYKLKDEVCSLLLIMLFPPSFTRYSSHLLSKMNVKGTQTQSGVVFAGLTCCFVAVMVLKVLAANCSCLTRTPLEPRKSDQQSLRQP